MPEFGVAEMLMQFRDDGKFHPWLLEGIKRTDDLTWVLSLRKGLTFQNGKKLDASAVVACMKRQMQHSGTARGAIPSDTIFEARDPTTIVVRTTRPLPSLPGALSHEDIFMIYDAETVDKAAGDWASLAGAGIYTGPYAISSLSDTELRLTRNEQYWQGRPALPAVSVRFISDPQARILAVKNDEADIALYPPTAAKPVVDKTPGLHFNCGTAGTGGFMMVLNLQKPPFDELAVRKAIIQGINYEELSSKVFTGVFEPATSWYAPIFPWAVKNQRTDIKAAERLLDEAGWAKKPGGIREKNGRKLGITLLIYPQQPDLIPMSNYLQNQLRKLGFDIAIQSVDDINSAMLGKAKVDWNAGLIGNSTTSWGTVEPILKRYYQTDGDRNFGHFSNAEIDKLSSTLAVTVGERERFDILRRIQEIMIVEEPYAFNLNISKGRVIVNDRYRGYQPGFSLYHVSWQTRPTVAE
jgi:peptide/nickel transport system substrate-binding protein